MTHHDASDDDVRLIAAIAGLPRLGAPSRLVGRILTEVPILPQDSLAKSPPRATGYRLANPRRAALGMAMVASLAIITVIALRPIPSRDAPDRLATGIQRSPDHTVAAVTVTADRRRFAPIVADAPAARTMLARQDLSDRQELTKPDRPDVQRGDEAATTSAAPLQSDPPAHDMAAASSAALPNATVQPVPDDDDYGMAIEGETPPTGAESPPALGLRSKAEN